jgi:hypothetical protein
VPRVAPSRIAFRSRPFPSSSLVVRALDAARVVVELESSNRRRSAATASSARSRARARNLRARDRSRRRVGKQFECGDRPEDLTVRKKTSRPRGDARHPARARRRQTRARAMDANEHDDAMEDTQRQIARLLPDIIRGADLEKATVRTLQKSLENSMGRDLGEHKNFIRAEVRARARARSRRDARAMIDSRFGAVWEGFDARHRRRCVNFGLRSLRGMIELNSPRDDGGAGALGRARGVERSMTDARDAL